MMQAVRLWLVRKLNVLIWHIAPEPQRKQWLDLWESRDKK